MFSCKIRDRGKQINEAHSRTYRRLGKKQPWDKLPLVPDGNCWIVGKKAQRHA